jgi:hypothetical protein
MRLRWRIIIIAGIIVANLSCVSQLILARESEIENTNILPPLAITHKNISYSEPMKRLKSLGPEYNIYEKEGQFYIIDNFGRLMFKHQLSLIDKNNNERFMRELIYYSGGKIILIERELTMDITVLDNEKPQMHKVSFLRLDGTIEKTIEIDSPPFCYSSDNVPKPFYIPHLNLLLYYTGNYVTKTMQHDVFQVIDIVTGKRLNVPNKKNWPSVRYLNYYLLKVFSPAQSEKIYLLTYDQYKYFVLKEFDKNLKMTKKCILGLRDSAPFCHCIITANDKIYFIKRGDVWVPPSEKKLLPTSAFFYYDVKEQKIVSLPVKKYYGELNGLLFSDNSILLWKGFFVMKYIPDKNGSGKFVNFSRYSDVPFMPRLKEHDSRIPFMSRSHVPYFTSHGAISNDDRYAIIASARARSYLVIYSNNGQALERIPVDLRRLSAFPDDDIVVKWFDNDKRILILGEKGMATVIPQKISSEDTRNK